MDDVNTLIDLTLASGNRTAIDGLEWLVWLSYVRRRDSSDAKTEEVALYWDAWRRVNAATQESRD